MAAWLRLMAARVMSCNWRPERERATLEEPLLVLRGVKKRVKRFGVMGGGLLGFRAPNVDADAGGGEDEKSSGVGSCSQLRGAHGDDMFSTRIYVQETASRKAREQATEKRYWLSRHGMESKAISWRRRLVNALASTRREHRDALALILH